MPVAPRIIVVGAGIIGASIAWHLAAAGAAVTVLGGRKPGGIATAASFAWINASHGNPEPYRRLRLRSIAAWRNLAEQVPDLPLAWTGSLCWDLPAEGLEAYVREQDSAAYPLRLVGAGEALRLEPGLAAPPELAVHAAAEGMVEPVAAAQALLADARRRGAGLASEVTADGLVWRGGRIGGVATSAGELAADRVVLAAGAATLDLAGDLGLPPLNAPPGLLAHSRPCPPLLNGLLITPGLHLRQTRAGRIVAGASFAGADPGPDPAGVAADLLAAADTLLRQADGLALDFHTIGYRPTPADGFPLVGRTEAGSGLYLAVLHSGVTLAPVIGQGLAQEILAGEEESLLAPYRPQRFLAAAPGASGR